MKSFFGKRPAVARGTGGGDGGGDQAHRTERIGEKGREGKLGERSESGRAEGRGEAQRGVARGGKGASGGERDRAGRRAGRGRSREGPHRAERRGKRPGRQEREAEQERATGKWREERTAGAREEDCRKWRQEKKPRRRKRRRGRGERNVVRRRLRGVSAGYACRGMCRRACGGGRPGTPRVLSALLRPFGVPSGRRVRRGGIRARDGCVDCRRVAAEGRMLPAFFVLSAVFSLSSDTLTTG